MTNPTVSVCITTYNHEDFIQQAIDSTLSQRTEFPIEILIGEDGSGDGTRKIVQQYEQMHKGLIRAFYHEDKDKIYVNGRKTGRKNLAHNLCNARGKYIALLDGDDYWIHNEKLQTQVDILEKNPEYSICFHNAICVDEQGEMLDELAVNLEKEHHDLKSILAGNPIPTMSVVFRNPFFKSFPEWFYQTVMGDWALHILNATRGDALYIRRVLAAYRIHDNGAWKDFRKNKIKSELSQLEIWELLLGNISKECDIYLCNLILDSAPPLMRHFFKKQDIKTVTDLLSQRIRILKKMGQSYDKVTNRYKRKLFQLKYFGSFKGGQAK